MAHLNVTKMSIYHIFGGTSEKLTGQVLTRSSLVSPAICKFFFSFLMCIYLCCAEISTECHHIALWVLCRTQLWGQSGEKGMHGVMLPFILPFSFNIVLFLLSQQFISLCLTFVVPFCPLNSRAVIRYTTFTSNNLTRWVLLAVFICCPCGTVSGSA